MKLIFEDNVPPIYRSDFIMALKDYSADLGIDPNWLMAVINFESAGSFAAGITNPTSAATGLIQFMPETAAELGTSIFALAAMTAVEQLHYVHKYYNRYRGNINSYMDLYFATFFPLAMGKPKNFVLEARNLSASTIANANPIFDLNSDHKITVEEVTKVMINKIPDAWKSYFNGSGGGTQKKSGIGKLMGISILGLVLFNLK